MAGVSVQELESFLTQRGPRHLSAAIKRAATRGGATGMIVFGMIFILFSLPFMVFFLPLDLHRDLLMRRETPATVVGTVTAAPDSNLRVNDRPVYTVRFSFAVDGVEHSGLSYSMGRRYSVGESVQIEYVPGNPDLARIQGTSLTRIGWFGLIVLVFPLAGLGVAYGGVCSYRSKMNLLRNGVFASGEITDISATNTSVNHQRVHKITIEYKTGGGRSCQSAYKTYHQGEIALAREKQSTGQTVGILYLPEKPEKVLFVDGLVKGSRT